MRDEETREEIRIVARWMEGYIEEPLSAGGGKMGGTGKVRL